MARKAWSLFRVADIDEDEVMRQIIKDLEIDVAGLAYCYCMVAARLSGFIVFPTDNKE